MHLRKVFPRCILVKSGMPKYSERSLDTSFEPEGGLAYLTNIYSYSGCDAGRLALIRMAILLLLPCVPCSCCGYFLDLAGVANARE